MKKKSISLLATLVLVASLTACGNKAEETANTNSEKPVAESQEIAEPTEVPIQDSSEVLAPNENDSETKMAAFDEMWASIESNYIEGDSGNVHLFEMIMQYCMLVNGSGKSDEGIPHEDAIECMRDYFQEEDSYKAFVDFMNNNAETILSGYDKELEIWYTEDFDSLYNEFLSHQQTNVATVDTIEKALVNISVTNNVIFSENGVTLTYDYYDAETQKMFFTLENNNDSNKKAFLHIEGIYINGIGIMDSYHNNRLFISDGVGNAEDGIENSNTVQLEYYIGELVQLDKLYTNLGTNYTESPFETIQFDYRLQIGSNSDFVYDSTLMQTTHYANDSFSSLFGEQLTSLEVANASDSNTSILETFGNFTDTKWIFAIKSETFEKLNVSTNHVWVNGAELDANADYTIYNLPNGRLYIMNYSEDELRKKCEIGNDEPLNVNVDINYVQQTLFTK